MIGIVVCWITNAKFKERWKRIRVVRIERIIGRKEVRPSDVLRKGQLRADVNVIDSHLHCMFAVFRKHAGIGIEQLHAIFQKALRTAVVMSGHRTRTKLSRSIDNFGSVSTEETTILK